MVTVIIADKSALMRKTLSGLLNSDPDVRVVDTAMTGEFTIKKIIKSNPDVALINLNMPDIDGITLIKRIMKECPLPVISLIGYNEKDSRLALDAVSVGAVDFVRLPDEYYKVSNIEKSIISKIKTVAGAKIVKFKHVRINRTHFSPTRKKVIVIGSSTGGPQTLESLLPCLPGNIPVPIIVAQHMPSEFTESFASRLNSLCDMEIREAKDGDELKDGLVLIVPGGCDMILDEGCSRPTQTLVKVIRNEKKVGPNPNINKLFKSVAGVFQENTIGVVLTGMGRDGTEGCMDIKKFRGIVIAESEESSIIYGMPKSVIEAGLADEVLRIDKIAVALIQLVEV
ncbi:chemotaxis-specific protein-glutamate methyltransferase CheB [Candidatus Woesearchaeota archaeon]|nr:chemotaxis-specific protein-glutamate methyltransferase CheB [Candidatus Woesearchaeota archaeon]